LKKTYICVCLQAFIPKKNSVNSSWPDSCVRFKYCTPRL
jgi:hypothetical protein